MRRISWMIFGLFAILILPFTVVAESNDYVQENGSNKIVDHSLFTAGNIVNSTDTVNGLNFVAGNSIFVSGDNEYGVFAGNDINVTNKIEKDLFVAGNNIVISKEAQIGRDVYVAGSNITINTTINKNAFIAGNIVTLKDATINGDVRLACENLIIEGTVAINGALYVDNEANIKNENSLMVDKIEKYSSNEMVKSFNVTDAIASILISLASIMVVGFIINSIFPKLYDRVVKDLSVKNELKNVLLGLVALIVVPIISFILLFTIIGLRLGFILLLIYILALLVAMLYAACIVGSLILTKLFKAKDNSYLSIAIGLIVLKLIAFVPVLGGTIYFIAFVYGLGKTIELYKNR